MENQELIRSAPTQRRSKYLRYLALFVPSLIILFVGEIALRLFVGAPHGYFRFLEGTTPEFLYPPRASIMNSWGPRRYTVHTNNLGLRGEDVSRQRAEDVVRIVGIGDSVTDGFFVGNDETFVSYLQRNLRARYGDRIEVINAARGGGSIDKELTIWRQIVRPLDPQVVILTFVTNDIAEILGTPLDEMLNAPHPFASERSSIQALPVWFINNSAIAEFLYRLYWRYRFSSHSERNEPPSRASELENKVPGEHDVLAYANTFLTAFRDTDALVLGPSLNTRTHEAVENYLHTLSVLSSEVRATGAQLVFVYFPAYSEVYLPNQPRTIRTILQQRCNQLSILFLDLTPIFINRGRERSLHFAPDDFHPNPLGHKLIADELFSFGRNTQLWAQSFRKIEAKQEASNRQP